MSAIGSASSTGGGTTSGNSGEKKQLPEIVIRSRTSSSSSSNLSIKTPKVARFTEATSVNSPIEPRKNPFKGPPIVINTSHVLPQPQPADIGFGYMSSDDIKHTTVEMPMTPMEPKTPMKSALKVPGTPGRFLDPRSPTFHEELRLEKEEIKTEKQNAKDFKQKKRVRVAKFFLRGVNFSCALIVLAMLSTSLTIFNATRNLALRSNLPPWAAGQQIWPQITLLVVSSVSLFICVCVFWSYWRGGHRKAQKTVVYYTAFSIGIFVFSTVMWILAAALLHSSRAKGNNQDFWGWSCNQNKRSTLFQDEINYALVCRLQNWALVCCLIEVVIETLTILIYVVVLWRIISKRRLHKSMNNRDKARSDLYLAQLRIQSAPNTPGFKSSTQPEFPKHLHDDEDSDDDRIDSAEKGQNEAEWARKHKETFASRLSVPPPPGVTVTSATPVMDNGEWSERHQEHMSAAPGEQSYAAVPIPGAYGAASPSYEPVKMQFPDHR